MSRVSFFSEFQKNPKAQEITSSIVSSGVAGIAGCGAGYAPRVYYLYKLGGGVSFAVCAKKQYVKSRVPILRKITAGSFIALRNAPLAKITFIAPYVYYKEKNKLYGYSLSALLHAVATYSSVLGVLAKQSFGKDVAINVWSPDLLRRNGLLFLIYIAFSNTVTFEAYERLEPLGKRLARDMFNSNSELAAKSLTLSFSLPLASAMIVPVEKKTNDRLIKNMERVKHSVSPSEPAVFKPLQFSQTRRAVSTLTPRPKSVKGSCLLSSSQSTTQTSMQVRTVSPTPNLKLVEGSRSLSPSLPAVQAAPTLVREASPAPGIMSQLKTVANGAVLSNVRRSLFLFSARSLWKAIENGFSIGGSEFLHKEYGL